MAKNIKRTSTSRLVKLFKELKGNVYQVAKRTPSLTYMAVRYRLIHAGLVKGCLNYKK